MSAFPKLSEPKPDGQVLAFADTAKEHAHSTFEVKIEGDGTLVEFHNDLRDGPGFAFELRTNGTWTAVNASRQEHEHPQRKAMLSRPA